MEVAIAGRVMQIRVQGKAGFAQLQQGGVRLQIYVRKDAVGEAQFGIYKLLDLGDHVGVKGYLFVTRTGETTVHVTELRFLAKAMLALPDKYHGLGGCGAAVSAAVCGSVYEYGAVGEAGGAWAGAEDGG